ncbi:hypothetical protein, partial [Staphylococcus epidermidis]|uniref:hypothetical protein n=1 Tax=Staphylococcus epidermidis TaxID=1282 RepID=UPI001C92F616
NDFKSGIRGAGGVGCVGGIVSGILGLLIVIWGILGFLINIWDIEEMCVMNSSLEEILFNVFFLCVTRMFS